MAHDRGMYTGVCLGIDGRLSGRGSAFEETVQSLNSAKRW
jgi:hypothetical protein